MPAGPFPTKTMHEALKTRVTTLEGAGGGGGGGASVPVYEAMPSLGSPTAPTRTIFGMALRWTRRRIVMAGFRMAGDITAASIHGVSLQRGPYGNEAVSVPGAQLTRRTVNIDGLTFTEFLLPQPQVATDTTLNIGLDVALDYPVSTVPANTPAGVSNAYDADYPYLVVLTDTLEDLPLVPEPLTGTFVSSDPALTRTELVWPASGDPYLHVVQGEDQDGNAAVHYHLMLTPGLPQ